MLGSGSHDDLAYSWVARVEDVIELLLEQFGRFRHCSFHYNQQTLKKLMNDLYGSSHECRETELLMPKSGKRGKKNDFKPVPAFRVLFSVF